MYGSREGNLPVDDSKQGNQSDLYDDLPWMVRTADNAKQYKICRSADGRRCESG